MSSWGGRLVGECGRRRKAVFVAKQELVGLLNLKIVKCQTTPTTTTTTNELHAFHQIFIVVNTVALLLYQYSNANAPRACFFLHQFCSSFCVKGNAEKLIKQLLQVLPKSFLRFSFESGDDKTERAGKVSILVAQTHTHVTGTYFCAQEVAHTFLQ